MNLKLATALVTVATASGSNLLRSAEPINDYLDFELAETSASEPRSCYNFIGSGVCRDSNNCVYDRNQKRLATLDGPTAS